MGTPKKIFIPVLLLSVLFSSCFKWKLKTAEIQPEAYVPVYGIDSSHRIIHILSPQPTLDAGKIYVVDKRLFQVEKNKGIHIIDYSDVKYPKKIAFLSVFGCGEVVVKNNIVLTNNMNDLVSIDINNLQDVKEVARVQGAFKMYYNYFTVGAHPLESNMYYVCPDPYSGDVVGWRLEKNVHSAYCKTN